MGTLARENGESRARRGRTRKTNATEERRRGEGRGEETRINPQLSVRPFVRSFLAGRTWNVNWPMTPTFYDVLTEEGGRPQREEEEEGEGRTHVEERVVETRSLSRHQ